MKHSTCKVFPRPISSARIQPFDFVSTRYCNHATPAFWCGLSIISFRRFSIWWKIYSLGVSTSIPSSVYPNDSAFSSIMSTFFPSLCVSTGSYGLANCARAISTKRLASSISILYPRYKTCFFPCNSASTIARSNCSILSYEFRNTLVVPLNLSSILKPGIHWD